MTAKTKELIKERRKLIRRLDAANRAAGIPGRRNTRGLDALMALDLFDKQHPEIMALRLVLW